MTDPKAAHDVRECLGRHLPIEFRRHCETNHARQANQRFPVDTHSGGREKPQEARAVFSGMKGISGSGVHHQFMDPPLPYLQAE